MSSVGRILACIALALLTTSARAQTSTPPLELFAQLPQMQLATLSPDGSKLAFITSSRGERVLVVRDLATSQDRAVIISEVRPISLNWGGERYVLLAASEAREFRYVTGTVDYSAVLSFDLENDLEFRQLMRGSGRVGRNFSRGRVLGLDHSAHEIFIPAFNTDGQYDLFAAAMGTSGVRTLRRGGPDTYDWVISPDGEAVARVDYSNDRNRQRLWVPDGSSWRIIREYEDADRPRFSAWGLLPDGDVVLTYYGDHASGGSTRGAFAHSLETGDYVRTLFHDPAHDLSAVLTDPYTNQIIGARFEDTVSRTQWFDPEMERHQRSLDAAFQGRIAQIADWSEDRQKLLVHIDSETAAPLWYLYHADEGRAEVLAGTRGELSRGGLPQRMAVEFTARDGTSIPAYVTLPDGDAPYPTVVMPHGGPASRDLGGFDYLAHFLASRGYAVIQPNFRGSDGYGWRWEAAGYGEWGTGIMQHDVSDAAEALIISDLADPDRICIMGWSYGGYAALAGAAFTPDLYQCAISIAGVSDVEELIAYSRNRYGRDHWSVTYWSEALSGTEEGAQRDLLRSVSPRYHADQVQIPVLLIHGDADSVVPEEQSRAMERALRREGVPVRYVEIDEGGHSLREDEDMRRLFLTEVEAFLAEQIGE